MSTTVIYLHYSLIRLFTKARFMLHTVSRFGELFGVSILEDKGHARNELWDVVYHMSSVICKFSTLSFEYISLKSKENHWFLSNVVLDKRL